MNSTRPLRIPDLAKAKSEGRPLVMLTAYDATFAAIFDRVGCDLLLVGDSLGMVIEGHSTTIPVTLDAMVHHTRAVCRGAKRAIVVADMPFLTASLSPSDALRNAGRLVQEGGAHAVKIEGAGPMLAAVETIVAAGIPVMGHLGLTPQSVHQLGGFRRQARTSEEAQRLIGEAKQLQAAGAFAIVLECISDEAAQSCTEALSIPTIGIGSGPHCDGQVLVSYDLLGLTENPPSFAKPYVDLRTQVTEGIQQWIESVRSSKSSQHLKS